MYCNLYGASLFLYRLANYVYFAYKIFFLSIYFPELNFLPARTGFSALTLIRSEFFSYVPAREAARCSLHVPFAVEPRISIRAFSPKQRRAAFTGVLNPEIVTIVRYTRQSTSLGRERDYETLLDDIEQRARARSYRLESFDSRGTTAV